MSKNNNFKQQSSSSPLNSIKNYPIVRRDLSPEAKQSKLNKGKRILNSKSTTDENANENDDKKNISYNPPPMRKPHMEYSNKYGINNESREMSTSSNYDLMDNNNGVNIQWMNSTGNLNYKSTEKVGKSSFLKPRHTGSPPTQTQNTHLKKSKSQVKSQTSIQNQSHFFSTPGLSSVAKSTHEYNIFSKKKERPKLPQEKPFEPVISTDIDFSDFITDPNHVPLDCVALPALTASNSSQNLSKTNNDSLPYSISDKLSILNQTKMTSSWEPPDSWDVKIDSISNHGNENFPESLPSQGLEVNKYSNSNTEALNLTASNSVSKENELVQFQNPEDLYYDDHIFTNKYEDESQQSRYSYIRVFRTDLTFTTVTCNLNATSDYVCKKVGAKFFISDWNKYNLVVVRNKLERIIKSNEYPLLMQKRWLERLGYTSQDKLNLQGREDNSYCYRFIFKEIQLGREISPVFWQMPEVKDSPHIDLSGFGLTILPVYLFQNASEIISLDLSKNLNIQELHSDLTPTLTSLKSLSLSHNRIHVFPRNIHCIATLTHINLSFNRIRSVEHSGIEHLRNLLVLELQCNLIEDIPDAIPRGCQRLQYISLSNNRIKKIPQSLFHYLRRVLRHLDISYNRLVGKIPPEIGELEILEILRLNGNRMDGDIPRRLSECLQLREIDLRGNRIGSIMTFDQDGTEILMETDNPAQSMEVLSECKKLETLLLDGNSIRWLGKSSNEDQQFYEGSNDPTKFLDFPVLKKLSMSYRLGCGNQKQMIFRLTNVTGTLTELNLSYCGIEFLPNNFFTKFTGLEQLVLDGNRLRELPFFSTSVRVHQKEVRQIGPFKLRYISLYYNLLISLPSDIGELVELEYLDVRSNMLKTLPESIWECGKLRTINATSNQLEHFPIPTVVDDDDTVSLSTTVTGSTLFSRRERRMTSGISIQSFPPLSFSLLALFVADNHLNEDLCMALYFMTNLVVLNASYNDISDITSWLICTPPTPLVTTNPMNFNLSGNQAQTTLSWHSHLQELYLSGNNIVTLPSDIERLRNLSWLFLDNNKLSTIPGEVAKLNKLSSFDVGGQGGSKGLRYNINNWPYDWNWSWNLDLKYLNLSGNKRLEITPNTHNQKLFPFDKDNKKLIGSNSKLDLPSRQTTGYFNPLDNRFEKNDFNINNTSNSLHFSFSQRKSLSNFTTLTNLSMLGLMDVTCLMVQIPDENDQRRIRTTGSEIPQTGIPGGVIKYGISDVLCRSKTDSSRRDSIYLTREQSGTVRDSTYISNTAAAMGIGVIPKEKYFLGIWDVVIPQFRNKDNESLFGIFDGRGTQGGIKLAEYLFRLFAGDFQAELKKVEESLQKERDRLQKSTTKENLNEPIVLDSNNIKSAIRRTFLGLNKELGEKFTTYVPDKNQKNNKQSNKNGSEESENEQFGCSAVIVYLVGDRNKDSCTLYVANVGDGTCILSKAGGNAQVVSRSFRVGNAMDWASTRVYDQKITSSALSTYSIESHRTIPHSLNSSQGSLTGNVYTSSTSDYPRLISGLGDEMERIQNAGGWITSNGLVNGKVDLTRSFGYFDCLGSLNANPWIVKMELDFGENTVPGGGSASSVHLTPESEKRDDESDIRVKLSQNQSDEFLVLVNGSVLDAIRCGANASNDTPGFSLSTLDDTAQIIVDIARSALVNEGQKRTKGSYQYQGLNKSSKSTTGWGSAATKIRNIALSHGAYGARMSINSNQNTSSNGGMMVMVLGLRDLVESASRWMGPRRGSTETATDSLETLIIKRRGSDPTLKIGKRNEENINMSIPPSIEPPTGQLALVFTDIKNSTVLWETHAIAMRNSIKLHNMKMRSILKDYGGYEVKTDGDSFMVSFLDLMAAIKWCLDVQNELLKVSWPDEILDSEDGEEIWWDTINSEPVFDDSDLEDESDEDEFDDDSDEESNYDIRKKIPLEIRKEKRKKNGIILLFRGLCVRMGIHYGTPLCEMDPTTGRMDYFGPMVNRASRICSAAQGGQIFISSEVIREITRQKGGDPGKLGISDTLDESIADSMNISTWIIGEKKLKGLETPEILHVMYPKEYDLRHEFFSWMQSQKQEETIIFNNILSIRNNQLNNKALMEASTSEPARIDRHYVHILGNLCLRLEFLAMNAQNQFFKSQNYDERIPVYPYILNSSSISIPADATDEELTAALEGITIRIENSVSILNLIRTSPFNRILKTLGSYIDVNPNQILTALQEYVQSVKEREERLERTRNEREKREKEREERRDREKRIKNRNRANSSL